MTLKRIVNRCAVLFVTLLWLATAGAKPLKVAVVQTLVEPRPEANLTKLLGFIDRARQARCQLVVLPENALLPFETPTKPTKAVLDAAFEAIRERARSAGLCIAFADGYRQSGRP